LCFDFENSDLIVTGFDFTKDEKLHIAASKLKTDIQDKCVPFYATTKLRCLDFIIDNEFLFDKIYSDGRKVSSNRYNRYID
jgi:hypothetical protein